MSSNYFGDLIKKTTDCTASNSIHRYLISLAKNKFSSEWGILQMAYALGFEFPQHLSRMFKNIENITPSEYCKNIRNGKHMQM